jgi:hypothetical protein
MGTTSNEPVITSYAKAPARTITARRRCGGDLWLVQP